MYLRDVMVLPASHDKEEIGSLRESCDHVLDITRHYLPEKYKLGGLRRVVIELGLGKGDETRQYYDSGDGVGNYVFPDFDLRSYFGLPSETQEERITECVERTLLELAARFAVPAEPLKVTLKRVRESAFRLEAELGCSKSYPDRKFRVVILRRFAPGGVFVYYEIRDKNGALLHTEEIVSGAWIVTVNYDFRKSRWNGSTLEVLNASGSITTEIPCDAYIAA